MGFSFVPRRVPLCGFINGDGSSEFLACEKTMPSAPLVSTVHMRMRKVVARGQPEGKKRKDHIEAGPKPKRERLRSEGHSYIEIEWDATQATSPG